VPAALENQITGDNARRVRAKIMERSQQGGEFSIDSMMQAFEDADFEKMEEIRARVDAIVEDPVTADTLKAWYRQLCKRPCFHDEYLQAFNVPGVKLVHTDGKGVERITARGPVVAGVEYEVDCIIYATGFEVGTEFTDRAGFDAIGRGGRVLSEYWAEGMRTMHGIHVNGFPNMFIVQLTQGANHIANVPHNLTESGTTIAAVVDHAVAGGFAEVEVDGSAENAWMDLLLGSGGGFGSMLGNLECTPGYYNNEGRPATKAQRNNMLGYPGGPLAFFAFIDRWRTSGEFEGLAFR